jgi:FkbM family methyltransferase
MAIHVRHRIGAPLDVIFPKRRVTLVPRVLPGLSRRPLNVVDVGGAMGPDNRWRSLSAVCLRFMTFEPDARSNEQLAGGSETGDLMLPVALGESPGERPLFLTKGPFASSMYRTNDAVLRDFAVWPWYTPAGETAIPVDTLDACLARRSDFRADFVKIDVEGADLDVLKGGRSAIVKAFGVQIEVAFSIRNQGVTAGENRFVAEKGGVLAASDGAGALVTY